ncbi:phosphate ABC transporter permease PstA [Oleiharenicola lentus]|jgi:phosphate transport system permease protein|uniref:Phosphate transport system permease protein PstA n=1 Tax=Oleiharenicola lentus TaxID=2508720 RepID=A0A4Q1C9A1_9BACT|nr:phosphate ABC transporter permease PstA [Oleiharenicola lentus]RXK55554.1 phosphate ABC transporter permease PstA [Oleiharenicola lentus]
MSASDAKIYAKSSPAKRVEQGVFWLLRLSTYFVLACAVFIFLDIGLKGGAVIFQTKAPFINVPFLTQAPETLNVFELDGKKTTMGDREFRAFKELPGNAERLKGVRIETFVYSSGGIFPNIVGTILLVVGSIVIALVLGIISAIYLSEYASDGPFIRFLRLSIVNLAGVPSIVYGLFGFGMFVIALNMGVSLLAGWLTLAFMVLPIIITASEEALKAVPKGYREGSLALGATKLQTILTNVLPYALPGILTSSVLSIARVAGETAPIMFTAAFVVRDELPWQVQKATDFFFQGVMALPYHIYVVASKIPQNEYTHGVQYGTAFVFLFTVAAIAMTSIVLRVRLRKKYKW